MRALIPTVMLSIVLGLGVAACGGAPSSSTANDSSTASDGQLEQRAETIGTNPFIPENVNIGDCVSSMPRPNCGSEARSSTGQWLTFGALMAGMSFIGWRISVGIRKNERNAERNRERDTERTGGS